MSITKYVAVSAATVCVLATAATAATSMSNQSDEERFAEFTFKYGRTYRSETERSKRLEVFKANMQKAAEMQKRNPLAQFGVNEYSDMTAEEFKVYHNSDKYYAGLKTAKRNVPVAKLTAQQHAARPETIDWRAKGAVTYVKNQGQCGSCWSFSTTGGIEGAWFLAGHSLVALSEQEFVSCDTTDSGCNGGLMDDAFQWVINSNNGAVTGESDYPYVSGAGSVPSCALSGKPTRAVITSYENYQQSESAMATGCAANGPISIGVDASSWQTYQGGILTDCTSTQVDHGVLAVGYDLSYSTPYWIIKNSWGGSWGESGYIRVGYGSDQCLITSSPSHPIASGGPVPPSPPSPPSGSGSSGSGPTPPPPSPPSGSGSSGSGPVPPSPPSGGSFEQWTCTSFLCLSGCTGHKFQTGVCLSLEGGGSAIVTCGTSNLHIQEFQASGCSGSSQEADQPLEQCLQDEDGTYLYNKCFSSSSDASSSSKKLLPAGNYSSSSSAAKKLMRKLTKK